MVRPDMRKLKLFWASKISEFFFLRRQELNSFIPILCYHRVLPEFIENIKDPIYTLLPEQFESHMAFLAGQGFNSLSLQEFTDMARGSRSLKKQSVLVTFDDGYADNYYIAWPIAKKYKIKLNLFICTSNINSTDPIIFHNDGYLSTPDKGESKVQSHIRDFPHLWRPLNWQELREMRDSGIQIGFHSHRHRRLSLLTLEELVTDLATGLAVFEKNLGYRPRFFALPYGWHDSYTPHVIHLLRSLSLDSIFTTHMKLARLPCSQFIFPRITILQQDSQKTFKHKLMGAYDWVETVESLINNTRRLIQK